MALPPRFTAELRDRLTLSEIIGRRVKLTRAGREFKGCCPFHHEKTPSFYVNDDKQFYHCFGCGAHGDAIGFVMQNDNQSFIEAVEILAAQAGMAVPQQTPQEVEQAKKEKSLYSLIEDAAQFFSAELKGPKARTALDYITGRGVTEEMIGSFRLGFSPSDGQALRTHLKGKDYTDAQMIEAGLIRRSDRGGEPYSFFRERLMFPVADRRGRIVAFGGRVLPEHLRPPDPGGNKPPKYINSSDSPLFHKGRMLYGESHARQAAAEGQPVIVVEGYLDVMACFYAGHRGAVAPLGTALTEEQILALWKMIPADSKTPILCFDGDEAGRRAAARAAERLLPLLKPNHSALFAFLPEGQDPDSLVRTQGKTALQTILESSTPLVEFLWSHHTGGRKFDTPEARAGLAQTLEDEALRIADRGVQHYYRQTFRDRLYRSFRESRAATPPRTRADGRPESRKDGRKPSPAVSGFRLKRPGIGQDRTHILLSALINHPELFEIAEEVMAQLKMGDRRLDQMRQAVLGLLGAADPALDAESLRNHLIQKGFEEELALVTGPAAYRHSAFAAPGASPEDAREGWLDICRLMNKDEEGREIKQGGQALAGEFTPENEEKLRALQDIYRASEG